MCSSVAVLKMVSEGSGVSSSVVSCCDYCFLQEGQAAGEVCEADEITGGSFGR